MLRLALQRSRRSTLPRLARFSVRRWTSNRAKDAPGSTSEAASAQRTRQRLDKVNSRLPRFLHRYTTGLANAPISHLTGFLLLHELTAVVPLFALFSIFHWYYLPPFLAEGQWVADGIEKFGGYFRKKGWLGDAQREGGLRKIDKAWNFSESGVRVVVELAAAWAVVKAFLPLRLVISVWGTPWFARTFVVPITRRMKGLFLKKKPAAPNAPDAAKTGSVGGGAVPKKDS